MPNSTVPAAATGLPRPATVPLPRRGFLRGLASLPLFGCGVTLIGRPTAAAVPVTDDLHERYLAFIAHEHYAAVREHAWRGAYAHSLRIGCSEERARDYAAESREHAHYLGWLPDTPDVTAVIDAAPPSSRAAVILSAAGVPLIAGDRA